MTDGVVTPEPPNEPIAERTRARTVAVESISAHSRARGSPNEAAKFRVEPDSGGARPTTLFGMLEAVRTPPQAHGVAPTDVRYQLRSEPVHQKVDKVGRLEHHTLALAIPKLRHVPGR